LFLGRPGGGPLDIVWDTNVLVDSVEYGAAMWDNEDLGISDEEYASEVEGISILIQLWILRDIRFHVLPEVVDDAKKTLTERRLNARARAVVEFARALDFGPSPEEDELAGPSLIDEAATDALCASLPAGMDRVLVRRALDLRAHVFMTRDRAVLRARDRFASSGLLIASPMDLVVELSACGAILCMMQPEYAYWPVPDLERLPHLIAALDASAGSAGLRPNCARSPWQPPRNPLRGRPLAVII